MLLTFLCLAFDDSARLPPNRSELFRQALEILLYRWAAQKRVHDAPVYRDLHFRLEIAMLAEIAAPAFREGRYFFSRQELAEVVAKFLQEEMKAPRMLSGDQVLDAIEVQQGLIVQRAHDRFSFSHLTLQEYLTAVWFEQNGKIDVLVGQGLKDERWREVFVLLAGLVGKADSLLNQMAKGAERIVAEPALGRIIRWASGRAVGVDDEMRTAARRAYAIVVLRDYAALSAVVDALERETVVDRARSLMRIVDRERLYDRLRARSLVFGLDGGLQELLDTDSFVGCIVAGEKGFGDVVDSLRLPGYVDRMLAFFNAQGQGGVLCGKWGWAASELRMLKAKALAIASPSDALMVWGSFRDVYADVLEIPGELREWSGEQSGLDEYFYVCRLILECRDSAASLSRASWDEICGRLLIAPQRLVTTTSSDRRPRK
ncbi:hypothetical protein HUA74_37905 [Myxococcus sp. CA051A]|uniref:NACHT domain-containing protein n=1 Tax=Myxococcus sp. CA051A TaxID=2741739 RepID=UPI00157A97C7|nr:hypothetical protein [Myxococcus sp. CA051A]NTX66450.1 hypothetical protein [Myxococcus sp. CA051A]